MNEHLLREMDRLRRRLRRIAILRALGWTISMVVLAGILLGIVDYLFRFREGGMRLLLTGVWLAVAEEGIRRWVLPVLVSVIRPVALAIWAERVFPAFRGKLAAAVEFAGGEPGNRSPSTTPLEESAILRQAALREAELLIASGSPRWPLPWWELRASLGLTFATGMALFLVVWINPSAAATASLRLLNPFLELPWPRQTHLKVESYPRRIAMGGAFEVVVSEASGRLPDDLTIAYRGIHHGAIDRRAEMADAYRMVRRGATAHHRRENIVQSFAFRVRGGDDTGNQWYPVMVVEAPRITRWRLRLIPPSYTGWPEETSDGAIKALAGTKIVPEGQADRELRKAYVEVSSRDRLELAIHPDGRSFSLAVPKSPDAARPAAVPNKIGPDGSDRSESPGEAEVTPWVIRQSGSYRLFVEAADGTTNPDPPQWEVRVLEDEPPSAWVDTEGRIRYTTPQAKVPLLLTARDDLAIRRLQYICEIPGGSGEPLSRTVYQGPLPVPSRDEDMSQLDKWGESKSLRAELDLTEIRAAPGMTCEIRAAVEDYAGQSSESSPVTIRVVDTEQLLDLIAMERNRILTQLSQLLELQRKAQTGVQTWQDRMASSDRVVRLDAEALAAVDLSQRQIGQSLGDPAVGLPSEIGRLVQESTVAGLGSHPDVRRLQDLAAALRQIDQVHAAPAAQGLTQAVKRLRSLLSEDATTDASGAPFTAPSRDEITAVLDEVRGHQQAVEDELRTILQSWGALRRRFELRRRLEDIAARQQAVADRVFRLGQQTVGRTLDALSPEELEALHGTAQEQSALATEFDRMTEELAAASRDAPGEVSEGIATPNPASSDGEKKPGAGGDRNGATLQPELRALREALAAAREMALAARMGAAAAAVNENRLSHGLQVQQGIIADLRRLLGLFSEEGSRQADTAILQDAAQRLEGLLERQSRWLADLKSQIQSEQSSPATWRDLSSRQAADAESARQVSRSLLSANVSSAGEATANAAAAMGRAAEASQNAAGEEAATAAQSAAQGLQLALADLRRRLAEESVRQNAAEMQRSLEVLRALNEQQQELLEETKKAASEGASNPHLSQRQRTLIEETAGLRSRWRDRPIAGFMLDEAKASMTVAAERLERQLFDEATMASQSQAAAVLQKVLESLTGRSGTGHDALNEGQGGGTQGLPRQPSDPELQRRSQIVLEELKLARDMQSDILRRTEELELKRQADPGGTAGELAQLSERQSWLRQMLETLVEGTGATSESGSTSPPQRPSESPQLIPPSTPADLEDLLTP